MACSAFDSVLQLVRIELLHLQPEQLVTIGASMGGYAAIRVGLSLGASSVLAFGPQVFIDPIEREALALQGMFFDEVLSKLKNTCAAEGMAMTPLTAIEAQGVGAWESSSTPGARVATAIEIHVGGDASGDVREAAMLRECVAANAIRRGVPARCRVQVIVHARLGHALVKDLRDADALAPLLDTHFRCDLGPERGSPLATSSDATNQLPHPHQGSLTGMNLAASGRTEATSQATPHETTGNEPADSSCVELLLRPRLHAGAVGHSVFTAPDFATQAECESLVAAGYRVLNSYDRTERYPRERLPVVTKMDGVLLHRLLALVEAQLPAYAQSVFGQKVDLHEMSRRYSPGEPAVNVYTTGGEFAPHTDKEHMTLLCALRPHLCSPMACSRPRLESTC